MARTYAELTPEEQAQLFGTPGYTPGYDSNQKGSYEANFNQAIAGFTPDQLLTRYSKGAGSNVGIDAANAQAYKSFQSQLGRAPTAQEFAQLSPIFQSGGPVAGNAWLAQFAQIEKSNPANLRKRSGEFSPQVNQVFQSMLGRDATADEVEHFGSQLAGGNVDAYQLQDFLRGTPEYQTSQDKTFRSGLADELQGYDEKFFSKAKEDVLSRFGDTGGLQNRSSALDFALTDLMGEIADKRGSYLANLSSQQYGGNKELALGNYKNTMGQYMDERNYGRDRATQLQDYYTGRIDSASDYNRQKNDYMDYLNSQSGGGSQWGQIIGSVAGGGLGAYFGGPQGAQAGSQIGSGVGGGFDYYNSRR